MPLPETAAHAASRNALEKFALRVINASACQAILIANGAVDDPDGTGSAFSAQQATLALTQGDSVTDVLTSLGV